MLIRNENTIDIVKDKVEEGTSRRMFLCAIGSLCILLMVLICLNLDFEIIETYIFIFGIWFLPSYSFMILGIINMIKEKEKLIVSVSKDCIKFFTKRKNKNILLKDITKIRKVVSNYGNFLIIFYKEKDQERKYQFEVSRSNINLICIAIKEFKNDILIN